MLFYVPVLRRPFVTNIMPVVLIQLGCGVMQVKLTYDQRKERVAAKKAEIIAAREADE